MIAIVSHDAGGAEILSSWVRRCKEDYCLVIDGPAKNIFQRKLGHCSSLMLDQAIKQSDWVLCGTSGDASLERQAIAQAKLEGKKVVSFLDHWVNYKKRFVTNGVSNYPDEIWVGDVEAQEKAQAIFPGVPVVLTSNPYFEDIQIEFGKIELRPRSEEGCSVLYVCEPIRVKIPSALDDEEEFSEEELPMYSEEDALSYFLENLDVLGRSVNKIKIRPHPKEEKNKYDWAIQRMPFVIEIGGDKTLLEEIAEADVVVGCESMAMMVALSVNKKVISSIPPGGRPCLLPSAKIEHLQMLVGRHKGSVNA
ncbi:MAG: hypothetical protein WC825_01880 [Gallionellaceae bacterium]|jgi:hypothetical protein